MFFRLNSRGRLGVIYVLEFFTKKWSNEDILESIFKRVLNVSEISNLDWLQ